MHRLAARTVTAVSLAALIAGAAPVQAKSPHSGLRGGKKPIGEIVSFDAATSALVLELADGEELTATVDEDARVKLEHRGSHRRSKGAGRSETKGHGNPSNGSLEDLAAGALVLRMKVEDDEVTKIRLRPAPAPAEETPAEGDQSQDGTGGENDVAEDPADDSDSDDSDSDDSDDSTEETEDSDTPDDGESGDE